MKRSVKTIKGLLIALTIFVAGLVFCFQGCSIKDVDSKVENEKDDSQTSQTESKDFSALKGEKYNDFNVGESVVLGNSSELTGNFRYAGMGASSVSAADSDIKNLISGYSLLETDRYGVYHWNETVVKTHGFQEVENADGENVDLIVTVELNEGLRLSDGSALKADNYLAYLLAFSSPVGKEACYGEAGAAFVGYESFSKYDGSNETVEGVSEAFSGVRLINERKFSLRLNGAEGYYPYYYADVYCALLAYDVKLVLGEGVTVADDGEGAYLPSSWYEKNGDEYVRKGHILSARACADATYAFSGPYVIDNWNASKKEATLKINANYAGNWEGQKPHVETVIIRKVISETQNNQLAKGEVDILKGVTGGDKIQSVLKVVNDAQNSYSYVSYSRAGYGKLAFQCDFGPTMFAEVRQAVAYCVDRVEFANVFTGGYGFTVNGPYYADFGSYLSQKEKLESSLNDYAFSVSQAKKVLTDGGWTYNSQGENLDENWSAGEGVDQVRYKKLAASEYGVSDANKTYGAAIDGNGIEYKTVIIDGEYYLPIVINYAKAESGAVTDYLTLKLQGEAFKEVGVEITSTAMPFTKLLGELSRDTSNGFDGKYVFNVFSLSADFANGLYDQSKNWVGEDSEYYNEYNADKLTDPYDVEFKWNLNKGLSYAEALQKADGKLGLEYLSSAMVYSVSLGEQADFDEWFAAYVVRWNELLPEIPLYSNYYYDVYSGKILNYKTSSVFGASSALIYCAYKDAQ